MIQLSGVKSLGRSEKEWLKAVRELVLRYAPDAGLMLYGSAARGTRVHEIEQIIPRKSADTTREASP
jgi:hypothetical protein